MDNKPIIPGRNFIDMLREIQWNNKGIETDGSTYNCCPCCYRREGNHSDDCELNAYLQIGNLSFMAIQMDQNRVDTKRILDLLENLDKVTKVLGKGIGHILPPADFFALWNETEIELAKVIRQLKTPTT